MKSWIRILAILGILASSAPLGALVVSGRVLDPLGAPAPGVDLDFVDRATGDNLPLTGDITDAGGGYSVDVPAGSYRVLYMPPAGPAWAPLEESPVDVTADWARPDVTLRQGWAVTGRMIDHTGAPVVGGYLRFYESDTGRYVFVIRNGTDGTGQFSVLVACGTYDIDFIPSVGHADAARRLRDVEACADTDLGTIQLEQGVILQGTVSMRTSGQAVKRADINVRDDLTGERLPTPNDDTDNWGFYQVVVPSGTYLVQVTPEQGSRALPAEQAGVVVAGTTVLDFELERGVRLSGTVTSAVDAAFIESVSVNLFDPSTRERLRTSSNLTDALGYYDITVPAGTWDVEFNPPRGGPWLPLALAGEPVPDDRVLDVSLEEGFRLTGRAVRGTDLSPIAGVDTDLDHPTLGRIATPFDDTDTDGLFVLAAPPETGYSLLLEPPDTWLPLRVEPIDLVADWTDLGDLPLDRGVEVYGRLLRASDSSPVDGVDLDFIHDTLGEVVTPGDDSGADGTFSVWVPEGNYSVEVEPGPTVPLSDRVVEPVAALLPGPVDLGDIFLDDAAMVTGLVVEAGTGTPLPGVDLDFNDPSLGEIPTPGDDTLADGTFTVKVPPGPYLVDFEPPPGDPHVAAQLDALIDLPATDLGTIELDPAAFVTGRVLRASDMTPVALADLDFIHAVQGRILTPGDDTDAAGLFRVAVPPAAGYRIEVEPPAGSGLAPLILEPVDIAVPETDLGDLLLVDALFLEGVIRDPQGSPYEGCDLDVFEAGTQNEIPISGDTTDASGFYRLALPAGVYDVRAQPPNGTNLSWETVFSVSLTASPTILDFDLVWLLTGIDPPSGPTAGGTGVTVSGNRFVDGVTISLDDTFLQSVTILDPQTLTGVTALHPSGPVDIVARYPSGERGILYAAYEYSAPAVPTTIYVTRVGADLLIDWEDTGQPAYLLFRSENPDMSGATLLFQGAGLQGVDPGAAGGGPRLAFYNVE